MMNNGVELLDIDGLRRREAKIITILWSSNIVVLELAKDVDRAEKKLKNAQNIDLDYQRELSDTREEIKALKNEESPSVSLE